MDGDTSVLPLGDRDLFKVANGWDVLLRIEFPSSFGPNLAAAALKRESFSSDLQSRLVKEGLTGARIISAKLAAPGEGFTPADLPPAPTPATTAETTAETPSETTNSGGTRSVNDEVLRR